MKTKLLICAGMFVILGQAHAYDPNDLRTLKSTGDCLGCDLSRADLRGWALFNANLESADLTEANMSRTQLFRANLRSARIIDADLT